MILNKKIIRTMSEHKSRYIGAFVLIFLCCMLYVSFSIAGPSVLDGIDSFRLENKVEDAEFIVQNPIGNLAELEKEFDMVLEERRAFDYKFDDSSTLRIFKETEKLDKYVATKGSRVKSDNEILLDSKFSEAHGLSIGKSIKIGGKDFKISGYVALPDYIYPLRAESDLFQNPDTFGIGMVSKEGFEYFKDSLIFYSIKFNKDNLQQLKDYLNKDNLIIKWINSEDNPRISAIDGDAEANFKVGQIVPIAILVITCLLVAIVLWRLLKGEFVQIGTLYALGYKKIEILRHYSSYSVILAATGSILGTIPGLFLVKPLFYMIYMQYNVPEFKVDYSAKGIILSLALPFVFLVPTTVFVVMKALRMSPLLLIRGGGTKVKVGFLEKKLNLNRFKFNTKFKARELTRNIPRALLMATGVTFASMLLLFGFSLTDSINGIIDDSYNNVYKYNYFYRFNTMQFSKPMSGEITSLVPFISTKNDGENISFKIQSMQEDAHLIKLKDAVDNVLSFDKVIITRPLADKLRVKSGDSILVENKIDSKKARITIDTIAETYIGDFVFMPMDSFNTTFNYPQGCYTGLLTEKEMNIESGKLTSIIKISDITDGYFKMIKPLKFIVGIIGFVALLIGLIIVYIVTSLIIEENRANISLMKILGYNKKRIYSLILNSNAILVLIGYIVSVPIIISAVDLILAEITSKMDITIPAKLTNINIFVGFVMIWITYEFSKLISRRKIINISMAESLKSRVE